MKEEEKMVIGNTPITFGVQTLYNKREDGEELTKTTKEIF